MAISNSTDSVESNLEQFNLKNQIAHRFSHAAIHYDSADQLQYQVAQQLISYLPTTINDAIDLGCGTGKWTAYLAQKYSQKSIIGLDIALGMLQYAKKNQPKNIQWCLGDIEKTPLKNNTFDLLFSNLAIQWCPDLSRVLLEAYRILKPGGQFIFSTLAKSSLKEIMMLQKNSQHVIRTNDYLSAQQQHKICRDSSLQVIHFQEKSTIQYYQKPLDLLITLKKLGANSLIQSKKQSIRSAYHLKQFLLQYEQFRQSKGIPCTYEVIYCILKKKH